jgi:hypothetical protein
MPIFTETKTLKSLKLVPDLDIIITEYAVVTLKDDVRIAETTTGRSYSNNQIESFNMQVAPLGASIADIVASFSAAAIEQRDAAVADKATAEAALTAAQAQVATLQAQIDAYTPPVITPVADPEGPSVDDLQIRLALNASGLREAVELAVLGSDQSTKDWWDRASNFKRRNPMVIALGAALGKTDEELDGLWALAATLG